MFSQLILSLTTIITECNVQAAMNTDLLSIISKPDMGYIAQLTNITPLKGRKLLTRAAASSYESKEVIVGLW